MSNFIKELAQIGKTLSEQSDITVSTIEQSLDKPLKVDEVVIVDNPSKSNTDGLEKRIKELEDTIASLTENMKEPKKKKIFQEGTTATNPITGEKIVFAKGEWWNIDAK